MGMSAVAELQLAQRVPHAPWPLQVQRQVDLTTGCCCFKSTAGQVTLRLEAASDLYCPGRSRAVVLSAWVRLRGLGAGGWVGGWTGSCVGGLGGWLGHVLVGSKCSRATHA